MQPSLLPKPKVSWITTLMQKMRWAVSGWNATSARPYIDMGGGVFFDLEHRRLILPPDYQIHARGNLTISSDEHLMFRSGGGPDGRPGYIQSIWFNTSVDENGLPIRDTDENFLVAETQPLEEICDGCSSHTT